jgi:hypothetical protein
MAIKAVAVDDENTEHLIIGLNRDNVNFLLNGDVFTLPHGIAINLTEKSDIVLLFAETDRTLRSVSLRGCDLFSVAPPRLTTISGCDTMANKERRRWRSGPTTRPRSRSRKNSFPQRISY